MPERLRIDPSSRLPLFESEELVFCPKPGKPDPQNSYVELYARTNFSFLQAGSSPHEIVRRAAELGFDAIGIVDRDGLYGIVRAHEEGERLGVRIVVGCELTVDSKDPAAPVTSLIVHVETHEGYTNLCRILTKSHERHPKGKPQKREPGSVPKNLFAGVLLETILSHAAGLWCTTLSGISEADLILLKGAFGDRLSIGVHRHFDGEDEVRVQEAIGLSTKTDIPIVAHNAVRFAIREHKQILDVLYCIREGTTLDAAGRALLPNTEACIKSSGEMLDLFSEHPSWLTRSRVIANACTFSMKSLAYQFPSDEDLKDETPNEALRRLTYEGAHVRYPKGIPQSVVLQIEKELNVIEKIDVASYFLSVKSIVEMAKKRDILCQGRGSAANSAVCFCLSITAIDPTQSNLLFERFLSKERQEPPDIDVDFEHERREEVIQDIYARYGRERAAMVSEVISYRGKSALKEVGKVFGFSLEQVDRLSGLISWWDRVDQIAPLRLREAGFDEHDPRVMACLRLSFAIQGYPRHLSIHVGGFVLSAKPLFDVAPIEPATMANRTVIPWDKDDIETLGFFKVDVLGLGMLTAIRKAMDLVWNPQNAAGSANELSAVPKTAIDRLAFIPTEDPVVYESLCRADTVGVFQIESRAQMSMLPRLLPRTFYDLVIEVAIVRPGPIQGGMVHPYLRRRNKEESADPPHECLRPILDRTLGVPLFQEQVMEIAIVGAGYTGGEADQLRRDMAAWKKTGSLERHKEKLERGFIAKGISKEFAERLYSQIQGFGDYGFPESHASSFAHLVYASAWLKVHHPAAFAAALINSQPMGFYSVNTILEDARRHDVPILPIDVSLSDWDCTLENSGKSLRVGLREIKGLGVKSGLRIETAKKKRAFDSLEDLRSRAALSAREMEALAEAGALESIVSGRRGALWAVRSGDSGDLFNGISSKEIIPELPPLSRVDQLVLDFERTGLSVTDHPLRALRPSLPKWVLSSRDLDRVPHGRVVSAAGLVICRQRPGTASGVVFFTMEDELGFINLVLWSRVFEVNRRIATGNSLLMATGKLERSASPESVAQGAPSTLYIVVDRLEKLSLGRAALPHLSRDFH